MKEWLKLIAIPYKLKQIEEHKLKDDQRALLIFDCWAKHKTEWWIKACKDAGFEVVFVPGGYTGTLQPLDVSINRKYKRVLTAGFNVWLTEEILLQLKNNIPLNKIDIQDSMPILKVF